jgi:hypothetical protein
VFDIWIPSYPLESGDDENEYDDWAGSTDFQVSSIHDQAYTFTLPIDQRRGEGT